MSLCLAREGNFCAKLTWCPLAGRGRLVSGSDLHRPLLYFHLITIYHHPNYQLAARQLAHTESSEIQ